MFSHEQLGQQLTTILVETLSQTDLQNCLVAAEIVEPPVAKQLWQVAEAKAGIYIILAGKVRLLDSSDNLITALSTGGAFGEVTLFPEEDFQPYAARASGNLIVSQQ